jgi:hypothetical protein
MDNDPNKPAQTAPAAEPPRAPQTPAPVVNPSGIPLDLYERERAERSRLEAEFKKLAAEREEAKGLLAQLTEKVSLSEKERAKLAEERRADRIRYEARMAAVEHGAIDPDDVVSLIGGRLTIGEDGKVVAADETKAEVGAFVRGFLEKKSHLARPRTAQGSGAPPFPAVAPSAPGTRHDLRTSDGATAALRDLLTANTQPAKP